MGLLSSRHCNHDVQRLWRRNGSRRGIWGQVWCRKNRRNCGQWRQWHLLRCSRRGLHSLRCRLWGWRSGLAGLRRHWPGRLYSGDHIQVRWLWRRFRSTPPRFHLPDYDVLSSELVAPDPTSSLAVLSHTDFPTIRLRYGFRTVGDSLVSSSTAVLLRNDGKGLHHSSPRDDSHSSSTHTISNTPADSTANSAANSAYHTQWTRGSLQLRSRS